MAYLNDLFGIRLNLFANVLGCIGVVYSTLMFTLYILSFVRGENLCSPLYFICVLNPEQNQPNDNHFILELIYYALWFISSSALLLGNRLKNDLLFLPWLYVVICDMILLVISLTYSIVCLVKVLSSIEGDEVNRIILVQLQCMFMKLILNLVILALMAYIWKGMFSLYMMLPYKEIKISTSCSQNIEQEENPNEEYVVYSLA
ncbi:hypothetical protein ACFFRR_002253 [Megaselia abdita]